MNHTQILKRAWNILWSFRALWIFGILLALTTPSGNNENNLRYSLNQRETRRLNLPTDLQSALDRVNAFLRDLSPVTERTIITVVVVIVIVGILLAVLGAFIHYTSKTALVRMVDQYEGNGEKATWRQGFRLGWSRSAWRLFLVNLAVFGPVVVIFFVLMGCALLPFFLGPLSGNASTWMGVIATIGLAFLIAFLLFLVVLALSLVMETIDRVVVLQETGVRDGIRLGWQLVRQNFKDVFLMWLILLGIQIGFVIALIPVLMVLGLVGLLVGGGGGFGLYYLVNTITNPLPAIISGAVFGGTLFLLLVGLPLLFLGGLKETYISTVWTLTYRALTAPTAAISLPGGVDESPVLPA